MRQIDEESLIICNLEDNYENIFFSYSMANKKGKRRNRGKYIY